MSVAFRGPVPNDVPGGAPPLKTKVVGQRSRRRKRGVAAGGSVLPFHHRREHAPAGRDGVGREHRAVGALRKPVKERNKRD